MTFQPLHTVANESRATTRATVEVWTVDLNPPETFIHAARGFLSPTERAQTETFSNVVARRNFVMSHGAIRRLLADRLALDPCQLPICPGPQGKPGLAGDPAGQLYFNLSHSGSVGLIALSKEIEVGVDVERLHPMPDASRLAQRFFSAAEAAALEQVPEAERSTSFFRAWTRKEALLKATGTGIAQGLGRFEVSCESEGGLIAVNGNQDRVAGWTLRSWSPAAGYLAAVAAQSPNVAVTFHEFDWSVS